MSKRNFNTNISIHFQRMDVAIKFMQKSQSLGIYKARQNKWKDYEKINFLEGSYLYSCYHQSDFVSDWYRNWVSNPKRIDSVNKII